LTYPKNIESHPAEKNMRKARLRAYKKRTPLAAIRANCVECVGGELAEVRRCTSKSCFLYPFRFGRKNSDLLALWEARAILEGSREGECKELPIEPEPA